ncbi:MAG TPA: MFS transporter [Nitrososphaerales archaeon]|nr:MFS transporter [Nitrososphaerales archaeon]
MKAGSDAGGRSQGGSPAKSGNGAALLLGTLFLGYLVYAADRYVFNTLLHSIQKTLSPLTGLQVGLLGSAIYIGVLCTVFLAGHLSDRYGRWKIIVVGLAVFTAFTWLIGLADSFAEVFAFRLVSGLGEGLFWPVAMAAVASRFSSRKGLGLGIFYTGFDAGGVFGASVAGGVLYLVGDWRLAFLVAPTVGLAAIAGVILARRALERSEKEGPGITLGRDALDLLRQKGMVVILAFALLATWATVWQTVFLAYYYGTVLKLPDFYSALAVIPVPVSGAVGKVVLGGLSDRWRRDRLLVLASLAMVASYALFFGSSSFMIDVAASLSMGFFSSAIFPVMQSLAADRSGGRVGTAMGLTTTFQSVATILAPTTTGAMFFLGIGSAVALEAMIPALLTLAVAALLKEPRLEVRPAA